MLAIAPGLLELDSDTASEPTPRPSPLTFTFKTPADHVSPLPAMVSATATASAATEMPSPAPTARTPEVCVKPEPARVDIFTQPASVSLAVPMNWYAEPDAMLTCCPSMLIIVPAVAGAWCADAFAACAEISTPSIVTPESTDRLPVKSRLPSASKYKPSSTTLAVPVVPSMIVPLLRFRLSIMRCVCRFGIATPCHLTRRCQLHAR